VHSDLRSRRRALDLPVAVVHKRRLTGEDVQVEAVTGDVSGRRPPVVDDMIFTAGTVRARGGIGGRQARRRHLTTARRDPGPKTYRR
jgi:hypothetical protein